MTSRAGPASPAPSRSVDADHLGDRSPTRRRLPESPTAATPCSSDSRWKVLPGRPLIMPKPCWRVAVIVSVLFPASNAILADASHRGQDGRRDLIRSAGIHLKSAQVIEHVGARPDLGDPVICGQVRRGDCGACADHPEVDALAGKFLDGSLHGRGLVVGDGLNIGLRGEVVRMARVRQNARQLDARKSRDLAAGLGTAAVRIKGLADHPEPGSMPFARWLSSR